MESEEFEQIPWASLVSEQEDGVDKRIYLAVGVVGVLVVAVFGMRLLGNGSQPPPMEATVAESPSTSIAQVESADGPPTSVIIAEADLRFEDSVGEPTSDVLAEVTAEWFVTDWYTRDSSPETVRSIRAAMSSNLAADSIPHETDGESVTFVEWAKTVGSTATGDDVQVTVLYRAIRETDDGFVRDPVRTVALTLQYQGDILVVSSLPSEL